MLRAIYAKLTDRLLGLAARAGRQVADAEARLVQPARPPQWPRTALPAHATAARRAPRPRILVPPRRS